MDKVIEAARELGRVLQADARYIRYATAQQRNEEDINLQAMIAEFSAKRREIAAEAQKESRDAAHISAMNAEAQELYARIFQNESMADFTQAREELNTLASFINQIITGATNGQDPDTIEYQPSCGGSCASCAGCG